MKKFLKKVIRQAAAELYWKVGAQEEDNYAKNFIVYAQVPRDADNELVVAEIDKKAREKGGLATRILREIQEGPKRRG